MLKVSNLKMEYSTILFDDVNFLLGNNERVGLVGLNGCGKSTLIKIIANIEKPTSGKIALENEKVGYLPQEFNLDEKQLIGEYLESLVSNLRTEMWRVERILEKLNIKLKGIPNENKNPDLHPLDYYHTVGSVSEGLKLKLYLCKLLLNESTILLLDEPTNHLDIEGIDWLESFLKNYKGIIIVISHDRLFLNNLVNVIYEIDEKKLNVFHGNYDEFKGQKQSWIEKRKQEYILQEKQRRKLEDRITYIRTKFAPGPAQGRALKAAKTRMKREVEANEINKYLGNKLTQLSIKGDLHNKKEVVKIKDVEFGYTEENIISNSKILIFGKDKIWFYGPNGIGKSTLIKLITGELAPKKGDIKIGENIKWEYFSQDQSHFPKNITVRDYVMKFGKVEFNKSFGVLKKFLFPLELQNSTIDLLSPGQRARLAFAVFTLQENELLILDEPTNHLDIETKEVIENALYDYKGCILLISHDRYFVSQIGVNRSFTLRNKEIKEIL